MKIAINGFGRIGRPSLKIAMEKGIEVVAINDLSNIENLAYLLKYDTAYGVYKKDVKAVDGSLIVDGKEIKVFSEKDPKNLPWKELEVDVVLECTGIFTDRESVKGHLEAGAKKVIISAPTKDKDVKTAVMGVNEKEITAEDDVVANASCTTNCLAPVMKVLDEKFGVEKSMMSTIHSYTSTQSIVDGVADKDMRRGRAAGQSIIPATTGAAIATSLALPQLEGKFDGMAFRVPTLVGSAVDLVAVLKKDVTEEEVNNALQEASAGEMKNIIQTTEEQLVSNDIVGNFHSAIVQTELTKVVDKNMVKVVAWYDNEWGYSNRLVEMSLYINKL